jgi:ribose transport system ATP-binding protein
MVDELKQVGKARTPASASLSIRGLNKSFPGVKALVEVSFEVARGEVHALLGENGSGKSTCIKILSGYYRPDSGIVKIAGSELSFGGRSHAHRVGARFVHQDLGLVDTLSVADNLALGSGFPTHWGTIGRKRAEAAASEALERVGLSVSPRTLVADLPLAERTGVAVARALQEDEEFPAGLLVFDEPTATLPDPEVSRLMEIIRTASSAGIGILYVTHRLNEVFDIADSTTILREGRVAATAPVRSLTRDSLLHYLLGDKFAELTDMSAMAPHAADPEVALMVDALSAGRMSNVSLRAYAGEVLGIAGITGSGREVVCGGIFGAVQRQQGTVSVAGQAIPANRPASSIVSGLAMLSAERKRFGAFLDLPARENMSISALRPFVRWATLNRRKESSEVASWFDRLDVRPRDDLERKLGTFSGGNQQKILLGRCLRLRPKVLLCDEPTQGVDIGAKASLHEELLKTAADGAAVIISSSDTEELVSLCNRILVFRGGSIGTELRGTEITVSRVVRECLMLQDGETHS